ncbi:MAG: hypothetical protein LC751_07565 [Actinobacteria bacterium]|nr:hypothetical protein [Actinomycetota bacterium]
MGWVRDRLEACDWTKVDWITVRRGRSERYAFRGVCKSPPKGHGGYRINCNVSGHTPYPIAYYMRVSPLYRNPDGTWPKLPKGYKVSDGYVASREGKCVQWRRLYLPLELGSEDEVLVFLVAHEAFHYLRRTRQVEGRHGEIEADAFALKTLEQYRDGRYAKGGKELCWGSKPAPG